MKKLFLDTGIVVDLLAERAPYYRDAARIFSLADNKKLALNISALSAACLYYVISQHKKRDEAKVPIRKLKVLLHVIALDDKILDLALHDAGFDDLEDGIQYFSALEHKLDIIISNDPQKFRGTKIPVMTANQFIKTAMMKQTVKNKIQ